MLITASVREELHVTFAFLFLNPLCHSILSCDDINSVSSFLLQTEDWLDIALFFLFFVFLLKERLRYSVRG